MQQCVQEALSRVTQGKQSYVKRDKARYDIFLLSLILTFEHVLSQRSCDEWI
jgi:hypothetical protein